MANASEPKRLSPFIYRRLTLRLLFAGLIISLLFGTLSFAVRYRDIEKVVIEDALNGLDLIIYQTRHLSASQGIDLQAAFQQVLAERFPIHFRRSQGFFVYACFYNAAGVAKGEYIDSSYPLAPQARAVVRESPRHFPPADVVWHRIARIAGQLHIHLTTPISFENQGVIGYADIVFAVSAKTIQNLRVGAVKTVLAVLCIVLATTFLLYPVILHLMHQLARYSETLLDANLETLSVLGSAIAKRDSDTDAHNYRVTIYAVRLAEALKLDKQAMQRLIKGAFLHDVGKIGIRDDILLKPGPLSDLEYTLMKQHVQHGSDIVHRSKWLEDAIDVVCGHHEKFDGSGYPAGLKSDKIPLAARIFTLADVFDALTSQRPYKQPYNLEKSLAILAEGRGSHFDPQLLDRFLALAPSLHSAYSRIEDDPLKSALGEIIRTYFSAGVETLTY